MRGMRFLNFLKKIEITLCIKVIVSQPVCRRTAGRFAHDGSLHLYHALLEFQRIFLTLIQDLICIQITAARHKNQNRWQAGTNSLCTT